MACPRPFGFVDLSGFLFKTWQCIKPGKVYKGFLTGERKFINVHKHIEYCYGKYDGGGGFVMHSSFPGFGFNNSFHMHVFSIIHHIAGHAARAGTDCHYDGKRLALG